MIGEKGDHTERYGEDEKILEFDLSVGDPDASGGEHKESRLKPNHHHVDQVPDPDGLSEKFFGSLHIEIVAAAEIVQVRNEQKPQEFEPFAISTYAGHIQIHKADVEVDNCAAKLKGQQSGRLKNVELAEVENRLGADRKCHDDAILEAAKKANRCAKVV